MFDIRLGLALRMPLRAVRSMPYKDWKEFRAMYELEPWGWWHDEEIASRILAMLHNINVKPEDAKLPVDFMRLDRGEELIKYLTKKPEKPIDFNNLTHDDIAALKQRIKEQFGAR